MQGKERGVDFLERVERKSDGGFREWLVRTENGVVSKWVAIEAARRVSFEGFKRRHSYKCCGT